MLARDRPTDYGSSRLLQEPVIDVAHSQLQQQSDLPALYATTRTARIVRRPPHGRGHKAMLRSVRPSVRLFRFLILSRSLGGICARRRFKRIRKAAAL